MRHPLSFFILLLTWFLVSCESETESTVDRRLVQFHVRNAATGEPISGVTIESDFTFGWTGVTDANGNVAYDGNGSGDLTFFITEGDYLDFEKRIRVGNTLIYDTISLVNPQDYLIASYTFSNNFDDSSGNGHHAFNHGALFASDRFNRASHALEFNGTTDYVSVTDAPGLNLGKQDFSFSVWYNQSSAQTAPSGYFLNKSVTNPFTGYRFGREGSYLTTQIGTTVNETEYNYPMPSPDSRWHHLMIVVSRSGDGVLYYDGEVYSETTFNNIDESIDAIADLLIGGSGSASSAYKGLLDDIRIYGARLEPRHVSKVYHENGW